MHFPDLEVCCDWSRFFPLKSADVCGAGTRDEPLRTSAWEANTNTNTGAKTAYFIFASRGIWCGVSGLDSPTHTNTLRGFTLLITG